MSPSLPAGMRVSRTERVTGDDPGHLGRGHAQAARHRGHAMLTMLTSSRVMKPATMHSTSAGQRTALPCHRGRQVVFFIETPHSQVGFAEHQTCVGDQARRFHARHGALLVVLRTIALIPDRARAACPRCRDQYAAREEAMRPRRWRQRGEEGRVERRVAARRRPPPSRCPGSPTLCMGDLGAQDSRRRPPASPRPGATRVQHGDRQRPQAELTGLRRPHHDVRRLFKSTR